MAKSSDGDSGSFDLDRLRKLLQLMEKYGVTAFISAGNSGPALSTLGSPGGDTASVIGVGAYVSSEMARVLYSQTSEAPSTAYNFSARGPAKNGDLGVDIMGPGGAHASLAYDGLQQSPRCSNRLCRVRSRADSGTGSFATRQRGRVAATVTRPDRS